MLRNGQYLQARQEAQEFLEAMNTTGYGLGHLDTESSHELTREMDKLAKENLGAAMSVFQRLDVNALETVLLRSEQYLEMSDAMRDTIRSGGKVFFYGCGATGRLSLSTGYLWRYMLDNFETLPDDTQRHFKARIDDLTSGSNLENLSLEDKIQELRSRIVDFMTGGDVALVNSIESAEDYPEWAADHLKSLGFCENDLLIASTEGGETPSVLGALMEATRISERQQYLTYCNPDEQLMSLERCRDALEHEQVTKINLDSGPMALAGSTRLQATTMQQLVAAGALFGITREEIEEFREYMARIDFSFLKPFTEREAKLNKQGEYIVYRLDEQTANIVYTDVTERNPTFSYPPLKHIFEEHADPSSTYVVIRGTENSDEAFWTLLRREPDTLETEEMKGRGDEATRAKFDFSEAATYRGLNKDKVHMFDISQDGDMLRLKLDDIELSATLPDTHPLLQQLFMKMMMNMHSTLFMGCLDRYKGNWMTWVKPSNNKLIDRCIRYVQGMLEHEGIEDFSYEKICHVLFEERMGLQKNEAIVLKVFDRLKEAHDKGYDPYPANGRDSDSSQREYRVA